MLLSFLWGRVLELLQKCARNLFESHLEPLRPRWVPLVRKDNIFLALCANDFT